jgi:hypothetical protein
LVESRTVGSGGRSVEREVSFADRATEIGGVGLEYDSGADSGVDRGVVTSQVVVARRVELADRRLVEVVTGTAQTAEPLDTSLRGEGASGTSTSGSRMPPRAIPCSSRRMAPDSSRSILGSDGGGVPSTSHGRR